MTSPDRGYFLRLDQVIVAGVGQAKPKWAIHVCG